MADNVAITAGSGTSVATDDVGGVHYQKVKLAIGANDTANLLAVGAGNVDTGTPRVTLAADDPAVVAITGTVAHSDVDSGNASKIGFKAKAGLSGVTLVSADDRTDSYAGLDGAMFVRDIPLEDIVDGTQSNTDGTSTEVIAAAGAGIKQYLKIVDFSNTSSSGVMVALKSATTSRWRVYVPVGGRRLVFDPPLKPNAANEAWNFDPDAATTTIECSMLGFKSKI